MQKKKVIGFILMLIAILVISFGGKAVSAAETPKLTVRESYEYVSGKGNVYYAIGAKRSGNTNYTADLISSITFVTNKNVPSTAVASWDASYASGAYEVIAWVIPNAANSARYDLYIGANSATIKAPESSNNLLSNYTNCTAINNIAMLDTSSVTYLDYMFSNCSSLTSLNLGNFNTASASYMDFMFSGCTALTSLNVSSFYTGNVVYMGSMFAGCKNLTSLSVTNFNTANVTDMNNMFSDCSKLTSLNVGSFNTAKVTFMYNMFSNCSSLTSLSVSNFVTTSATYMNSMFYGCSSLTTLNLSNFNTTNVAYMGSMFFGCSKLTSINLDNFNTANVIDMSNMFYNCKSLTSLNVSGFNTSKTTFMYYMFYGCSSLTSLKVNNFNTTNVTYMNSMFEGCSNLTALDLSDFNTAKVEHMEKMFSGCSNLISMDISNFNTTSVTTMGSMFNACSKLKAIILDKSITASSQAMKLSTGTSLENLPNAILYVHDTASEKLYEAATNYATIFADSRDTQGDLYRVRPILEVVGENPVKIAENEAYDSSVDAGVTIAGFTPAESEQYTQYGYNYEAVGLPLDTTTAGTKQITYTLTKTKNGTTTKGTTLPRDVEIIKEPKLMIRESHDYISGKYVYYAIGAKRSGNTKYTSDLISSITFVTNKNVPSTAEANWDASFTNGDNEVIAWVIQNAEDTTKYDLYIGANDTKIKLSDNISNLFRNFSNCTEINNLAMLDTTNVTKMSSVFQECINLVSLDLSGFDTTNVTDMSWMFYKCSSLTNLNLSNFITANVINMSYMFGSCNKLVELNIGNFNTSKVTNMSSMLESCKSLTTVDVSGFDTTNVTNMSSMFSNCNSLPNIDVSGFNTTKVTNMSNMFNNCDALESIDVSGFDTSNVTKMSYIFSSCSKITSIDVSGFNTTKVTDMSYMFYYCKNISSLNLTNFNTTNVTNMNDMFSSCESLTNLDVSNFDTSNVTTMSEMFRSCSNLTSLNVSNFDTSKVTKMKNMFSFCYNLATIDVSGFDTTNVTDMSYMFWLCYKLTSLDLSSFDTTQVTNMSYMFSNCSKLKSLDLSNFNTLNVKNMSYMFANALALESLDISNFDTTNVTNMQSMFNNSKVLKAIILDKKIASSDQAMKLLTGTYLESLPNAILYVHDTASEKLYETAANYSTIFADSRDTEGDLYRIRPILEVAGENPVKTKVGSVYDSTVDAGVTIAGFAKAESDEYTQYGYNYESAGLPVDTTAKGTKQVTYTLNKTENGVTTNGMTATRDVKVVGVPTLMEREGGEYKNGKYRYYIIGARRFGNIDYTADLINSITFVTNKNVPSTAEASWDVSYTSGDGEVIAWIIPNEIDSTKYDLYIGADDTQIQAPANSNNLFYEYTNCTIIRNLSMLDTSTSQKMSSMFSDCKALMSADVSNFDTSNVTSMYSMFYNCNKLVELDVSNFNTSNVTIMSDMFYNCNSLTSLDVSNFDTAKVTVMQGMFSNCNNLTSLDVSNFDTSNVLTMNSMFSGCSKLTNLDVSNFNTSNVVNMFNMFSNCMNLTDLDVSNFDTSNVTRMDGMFATCIKVTKLDVSGFDTSKVVSMGLMFSNCRSITSIDLRSFDTSSLDGKTYSVVSTSIGVDVNQMLESCYNLKLIIIGDNFKRLDGYNMFFGCRSLKAIITTKEITSSSDAPILRTENVTNTNGKTIAGPNGLINIPNAILYVPSTTSEVVYESATNYDTVLGADRIRPILEVAGENPVKVKIGSTYDSSVDAGATIAGFTRVESGEYTQYGYNYEVAGLPVDTTTKGTKQVTYTLTKTENGATTNGMTATRDVKIVGVPMLMEREKYDYINNQYVYYAIGAKRSGNTKYTADLISTITFVNNTNIPSTAEASWDVSYTSGDGEVIAWVIPNTADSTKYDLYMGTNDTTIQAPANSNNLFGYYKICTEIDSLKMVDTSNVIDMSSMFEYCNNLIGLDVGSFNTQSVTNMNYMFYKCNNLENLNVNGFDTRNVTNMGYMFYNCSKLTSLDVSGFNTTKVTDMSYMFYDCSSLTTLNVNGFDTQKVTDMSSMFLKCNKLTNLDVSKFNTTNVTNMSSMFDHCSNLTSLDVNNFDTQKVTNMNYMFYKCNKLTVLDVSKFNTTSVTNISYMFYDCNSLENLDVSNFNTQKVTNMSYIFYNCNVLTNLDVSNFDTSKVTDMSGMFSGCNKLMNLDVSDFNTQNVTNMNYMFYNCNNLTTLDASKFNTIKVTDMSGMFGRCNNLTSLDISEFNTTNVMNMSGMFFGCSKLISLNISDFDTSNVTNMNKMFNNCSNLKAIILDKKITSSDQAMKLLTGDSSVNTGLEDLPNAILYVHDTASEKLYEAATNYSTVFADSRDANGDLYRVRPILEVAGENPVKVKIGGTYDSSVDAGATIAGFTKAESVEYTQYGYNYEVAGLPVDTTTKGTKQVTYTLTKNENGATTNGMTTTRDVNVVGVPMLMKRETYTYIAGKGDTYYAIGAKRSGNTKYTADLISSITFVANKNVPTSAEASWDVSYTNGDNEVIAWVIPNTEDSTKYDLYIGFDNTIIQAPKVSEGLFREYTNCTIINNLTMLDTAIVTNMNCMFDNCSNLTSLDVSNFNTTNVTNMSYMFYLCSNLTSLDVSSFDTSNVTNMRYMFGGCGKLTSLDVSNFNTINVTNMGGMFYNCSNLTSLDVSNFNTTNVTNMDLMFSNCSKLTSLDVSNFNTTNVTNMSYMFSGCSKLTSLNVSKFDTSKVTDMSWMFSNCSQLTSLDVSNFNTTNVTNMSGMFSNCSNLTSLDVSNFNTTNVTNMRYMFYLCSNLTSLDVSSFDTSNVTNMRYMFGGCGKLTSLDVSNFNTTNVTNMGGMFYNCSNLTSLDVSNFNTTNVTNMNGMFYGCSNLTSLDVSGFDTSKVKTMGFMFSNCNSLKNIDLRSFDTSSLDGETYNISSTAVRGVDVNNMFERCENLESIIIGDKFNRLDGYDMFDGCNKLKAIITTKTITASSDAPTLSGTETVTNSNGEIIAGPNGLKNLPNAILYVHDTASEKFYEAARNYATTFADSRDANGDLYRVRPILEVAGENPVKVKIGSTYDSSVDAGATIAGFTRVESGEYTQYGYNYEVAGLPVDTTTKGTKQVTYTLTKTENGATTNGMTATRTVNVVDVPMLMERDYVTVNRYKSVNYAIGAYRAGKTKYTNDVISTITLVSNKNIPSTAEASWDVSYTNGNNEVIAWVIQNAEDSTKYDLYIGADDTKIQAPANSIDLFSNYTNCIKINNLEMLDTSKVTTMQYMFHLCTKLEEMNVGNFDTSNVTSTYGMFGYCGRLRSLNVSGFDTSKVTNMFAMFASCSSLTSLDVTNFDTSKVTTMLCMFTDCSSLTSLDVSNFNTSNVTDMKEMFADCSSLTSLDLSNFDTSKVTTMMRMFGRCSGLTDLNISSFNTSNVTDMSVMFASCSSLTNLDLSSFNTSNVTNMSGMFSTCSSLESLDLAHFDTRNAKAIGFMFYDCASLRSLIVTGTNFRYTKLDHTTAGVYSGKYESVDINGVFEKCSSLTSLDLSSWNITTSENMNELFADCTNLRSVVLGRNFAALKGVDMFKNCDNLRAIITKRTTPLTLVTGTGAETVGVNNPKVLYVETKQLESSFESASNYASVFGANRIRPILEVAGENPVRVKIGSTYDSSVDAGATIAGFTKAESSEYTQYGYNYTTAGLPLDTSTVGTKQVTYTLRKTENGTTTNGMTATRNVEVYKINLADFEATLSSNEETYIDSEIKPTVTVSSGDNTLIPDVDYKVSYKDNVDVGTATVTIEGIGNYEGTIEKTFTIIKRKITLKVKDASKIYDGTALTSNEYEIKEGELISGHVLTIKTTGSQTDVGTSTNTVSSVTIKNAANKDVTSNYDVTSSGGLLEVTEKGATDITVTLNPTTYVYDGTAKEPAVTVKDGTKVLVAGTDYDVEYKDNVKAGAATATVTLKGNYTGTITKNFTIERAKTSTATASDKVYTGAEQVGVTGVNVDLVGTIKATNVGTYTATATPKENYAWADGTVTAKTLTWKITAKDATNITAELSSTTYVYDGTAKEPTVTVKDGTKTLVAGTDYDVEYKDNVKAGTATVEITLKGNYTGTITKNFTIERAKTATVSVSDKVYTGAEQVGVTGVSVDLTGAIKATNVGKYTATATPKENYAWADGTVTAKTLTWNIIAKDERSITVALNPTTYVYDGTAKEPTVTVKDGTKVLVAGTDYDVEYKDNVKAGTATVTVTLKGNYTGTITKNFTIERSKTATVSASDKVYTGAEQVGVTGVNVDLTGTIKATNVGTYTATATPKENYAWTDGTVIAKTLTWKITAKDESGITIALNPTTYVYDGTAKEPTVTVKDGTKVLVAGTDYDVEYKDNVKAGTATATVTLKGNYSGTITKNFTIEKAKTATAIASDKVYNGSLQTGVTGTNVNLVGMIEATNVGTYTATATPKENYAWADGSVTAKTLTWKITAKDETDITAELSSTTYVYDGTAKEPTVTVKDGTKTLVAGTDYDVEYKDNVKAGTATVEITLKGNYAGTITKNFTIERAKTATATASDKTYTGAEQVGVTGVNVDLVGTIKATNVGTYTATATPKENYAWADGSITAKTLTWKITEKASSDIVATLGETVYTYDGTAKEPTVTVKDGTKTLTAGTDYDVEYKDNVKAGTATVMITLKGNYSGTITKNFTIERAKTATATASDKVYTGAEQVGVTGVNVDLVGTIKATNVGTYTATVTPKENYAWADGTVTAKTLTWKITAKDESSITVALNPTTYVYDGTAKEPTVTVKDGTKVLVVGTDYDVKYKDNVKAGTATATITLKGNYTGTITKNFTIERAKTATATASDKTYTGAEQVGVTGVNVDLTGTTKATNVGTYTATATPKENYAWADGTVTSKTLTWKITAKDETNITAELDSNTYVYDGTAKEPSVTVKDGTKTLVAGTDYDVEYKDNVKAGTATVTITLKGNYTGIITKNFTIERAKTATVTASDKVYTGAEQVGVTGVNVDLVGTVKATNVGTYTATATPKENYAWADGSIDAKTLTWKITEKASSDIVATLGETVYTYDGTAKEPTVTVKDGTKTLTAGADYDVEYKDNVKAGTATVTITLKGNYNGTIIKNFTIERAKTAVAKASDKVYNGSLQTGVTGTNVNLVGMIEAINVGTYTVTATPKENYAWSDGTITSKTLTWKITPKDESDITAELGSNTYIYDGTAKEPTVTVKDGTKTLVAGTDYDVEYKDNVKAGTATVTITLKGNYSGTITKNFTIERAKTAVAKASDKVYNGSLQTGVTGTNVNLVGMIEAINVGTYTVTATPKENYAWSDGTVTAKTLTWKITAKDATDITAELGSNTYIYDGTAKEPTVTVKDGTKVLVAGTDYDVEYKDNVKAGTATVTITLKGNYTGTITKNFTIEKAKTATVTASDKTYTGTAQTGVTGVNVDLAGTITATEVGTYTATATPKENYAWADGSIDEKTLTWKITEKTSSDIVATLGETVYTYDGTAKEPSVTVKDGTKTLIAGTDYDVEYKDNVKAGTATVTITLKGNYSGIITKNFTIERAKTATATTSDKIYNGTAQSGVTSVNVDLVGTIVAINVGTYTVTATPKENYAWADGSIDEITLTWRITAKDEANITVTLNPTTYTYDGTEKEPEVIVKDGTETLVLGTDYSVKYKDNVKAGTATVIITLEGNYSGTITKNFVIERAKTATATASDKVYTGTLERGVTGTNVNLVGVIEAINVGTYTATATPRENYAWADGSTDTKTLTWKITAKGIDGVTANLYPESFEYDGTAKEPIAEVKDGGNVLLDKTDYDIKYSNNINVGKATATITFKGNYTGTLTKEFTITTRKITVKAKDASKVYDGNELTSDVVEVVIGTLVDGHIISGQTTGSQTNVGSSTNVLNSVIISNASGDDVTENYDITMNNGTLTVIANSNAKFDITLSDDSFEYDGTEKEPIATVKVDGKLLEKGIDYNVVYEDNVDAGIAKVIIKGIGNYEGSVGEKTFTITKANITGNVEIVGKNIFGEILTADTISDPSESMKAYQWWYSSSSNATTGTLIPNATNKEYRIGDGLASGTLIGKYIGVTVKFSNGDNYNEKTAYDITTSEDNENATTKKADRTIELIDSKSVIRGTTTDISFTYTGENSSTSVVSSATDKATATVTDIENGGTIKVVAIGVGTANITLTVAESADYNAASKACTISVKSDNSNLMVRELGEHEDGIGTIYYAIGAQRAGKKQYKADLIKTITFVQENEMPSNAVDSWDVSFNNGDYNVRAWVIKNSSDNSMYDLYIGADSKIVAPSISDRMFRAYTNCISINGLEFLDTSKATLMNYMFMDSDSLTTLDLSYFDTSKVTGMMYMFSGCKALKNVDLSSFDTTNVTTMTAMFRYCENMTDVTFGNSFKTDKVTDMSYMFSRCSKLTKIDLSKFDTSFATNMEQMFAHCNSVKELQLQQFNTNKVTTMSSMFNDCSSLTKLDLSSFNTNNVTNMSGLFGGCTNLETITLGRNFETSNVEDMSSMFDGCTKLSNLNVSGFNTSKVTNMSNMFNGCNSITALDISNFDTSKVINMHAMFENCSNLRAIHLGEMFDTSEVKDMKYMFSGNSKLTAIITRRTIGSVNNAIKFSTDTGLNNLYNAILYVPNEESEKLYEKAENYSTIFGHAEDTSDDLYRVRTILELVGENPVSVALGKVYDESTDAGVTIAGFDKENASGYTQFGYNYTVSGLPMDTSKEDTKQVVYTLTYTKPGTTTTINEMKVTRNVEIVGKNISALDATLPQNSYEYTGSQITPEPVVKDGNVILEKGVDYEITYGDNIDAGYGTVTIIGKGTYTGSKVLTFEITLAKMSGRVTIKGINKIGNVLEVDTTKIIPTGCNLTYQWYYSNDATMTNGTAIDGETTDKYTIRSSNIGKYIYVEVTASKKNYETHKFTDVTDKSNNNYDMVVGNVDRKPTIRFEEKQVSTDSVEITVIIKTVSGVTRVAVNNSVIDKSRYQDSITKTNYEITTTFKYTAFVNGVFVFEVEDEIGNITKETLNISTIGTSAPKITYKKYNATYSDKAKIIFESDTLVKIFEPESYVANGITFSTNYYSTKIIATIAEGTTFNEDRTFTFVNEKADVINVTVEAPIYTKNVYIRMAKEVTNPLNITIKEACMLAENMANSKALVGTKVDSYYGIKGTTKVNVATGNELNVAETLGSSSKTMSYNSKGTLEETPTTSLTTGTSGNYMNNNITGIYIKTNGLLDVLTLITSSLEKYNTFRITIRP